MNLNDFLNNLEDERDMIPLGLEKINVTVSCPELTGFRLSIAAVGQEEDEVIIFLDAKKLTPKPTKGGN